MWTMLYNQTPALAWVRNCVCCLQICEKKFYWKNAVNKNEKESMNQDTEKITQSRNSIFN